MARRISSGLVGEPSVGGVSVSPNATLTTADNQDISFGNDVLLNAQRDLKFGDADTSNWVAFQAPSTIASNYTLTLPSTDGSSNQVLTTNGSGTLSWTTAAVTIADNTSDSATHYPAITTATSGTITSARVTSTKFTFQPSTGLLTTSELTVNGTARSLRTENTGSSSYVLALTDRDKVVSFSGAGAQTVTVPLNSSVAFPTGSVVYINRVGAGSLTLQAEVGVTLSKTGTFGENEEVYVRKRGENSWIVVDAPKPPVATASGITPVVSGGYNILTIPSNNSLVVG